MQHCAIILTATILWGRNGNNKVTLQSTVNSRRKKARALKLTGGNIANCSRYKSCHRHRRATSRNVNPILLALQLAQQLGASIGVRATSLSRKHQQARSQDGGDAECDIGIAAR